MTGISSTSDARAPVIPPPYPQIIDDKSPICIPFILSHLKEHQSRFPNRPFFIGLNGVQGAGKTTLVQALAQTLRTKEHLETLVCSIDDLYLTHEAQEKLAENYAENPLVQHRGEPGTHDMKLARELFTALRDRTPIQIPQYDKSAYNGQGDRVSPSQWKVVNQSSQPEIRIIIFEGWCVGFRALTPSAIEAKQTASTSSKNASTLHKNRLEDLLFINEKLREYDVITDMFNIFIHIDAEETGFVYEWRLQQEAALRREKGRGMTDEQVLRFVDGYYPAYELFTDTLREGVFRGEVGAKGRQLRLIVGKDRRVKDFLEI